MIIKEAWLGFIGFVQYLFRGVGRINNRRVYPRVPANHLLKITTCDNLTNELCNLVDISEGGLKFIARQKIQPGSRMQMLVNLSQEDKNIFLTGQVVWAKPSSSHTYHVGVQFTNPDFRGIECIRNFVEFSQIGRNAFQG